MLRSLLRQLHRVYRSSVKKALMYVARWMYILAVTFSIGFLTVHFVRQTAWYKKHHYGLLLSGSPEQRLRSATALALVGGESELLEALKAEEPAVHTVARRGLEYLWFTAAGKDAFKMVEESVEASEKEEFKKALSILDRVTAQHPSFAEGWNRRAAVLWQTGQFEKSIVDCERALKLNPNHYGALQGLGICQLQLGEVREACKSLRLALKVSPHDKVTLLSLERCEDFLRTRLQTNQSLHPPDLL